MTLRYRQNNPLAEIERSQLEEIEKYKWIESEKAGRDIGWERAQEEWLRKHFGSWKRVRWQDAVAEALRN
jgi:hypothetical protein